MTDGSSGHDYRDDGASRCPGRSGKSQAAEYLNPINMMATSKARGSVDQMRQLGGMRASWPSRPAKSSKRRSNPTSRRPLVLEYFSSTHGAVRAWPTRRSDADSGYLTRKLADVAQNVINEIDCKTLNGITKTPSTRVKRSKWN